MENNYNLRPIWNATLNVFDSFTRICEAHGLQYFVAFGTLIGAVRHKGFIPWDDDLDVYMPRGDYMRFIEVARRELPREFSWKSVEVDDDYPHQFGKVIETRQEVLARVECDSRLHLEQGIFMDVFPLDGLPSTSIGRFFWCFKRSLLKRTLSGCRTWDILTCVWGRARTRVDYSRWLSHIPYDAASRVGTSSPYDSTLTPHRWWHPKSWFDSYREFPFEGRMVRAPVGFHNLLSAIYGDYLTLPPEDRRLPPHQSLLGK